MKVVLGMGTLWTKNAVRTENRHRLPRRQAAQPAGAHGASARPAAEHFDALHDLARPGAGQQGGLEMVVYSGEPQMNWVFIVFSRPKVN